MEEDKVVEENMFTKTNKIKTETPTHTPNTYTYALTNKLMNP